MKTSSSQLELLQQKMAALETEVAQLRQSHCPDRPANGTDFASVTDRRGMMKKIAGLAVGVAAAGLLKPSRALANNTDPLTFGSITTGTGGNSQTSPARFAYNGAAQSGALFLFEDGTALTPSDSQNAVLAGFATSGPAGATIGVYGFAEATSGAAVVGLGNGVGGDFSGGRAALALTQGSSAVADPNAGVAGSHLGDVYCGLTNGSLWYNEGGSVPYCRLADST